MKSTTWQVMQVTEKPGMTTASLDQVEWFKPNPDQGESGDEFVESSPGEEGADRVPLGGHCTLDITEGPELHPGDNVKLTVEVL